MKNDISLLTVCRRERGGALALAAEGNGERNGGDGSNGGKGGKGDKGHGGYFAGNANEENGRDTGSRDDVAWLGLLDADTLTLIVDHLCKTGRAVRFKAYRRSVSCFLLLVVAYYIHISVYFPGLVHISVYFPGLVHMMPRSDSAILSVIM